MTFMASKTRVRVLISVGQLLSTKVVFIFLMIYFFSMPIAAEDNIITDVECRSQSLVLVGRLIDPFSEHHGGFYLEREMEGVSIRVTVKKLDDVSNPKWYLYNNDSLTSEDDHETPYSKGYYADIEGYRRSFENLPLEKTSTRYRHATRREPLLSEFDSRYMVKFNLDRQNGKFLYIEGREDSEGLDGFSKMEGYCREWKAPRF